MAKGFLLAMLLVVATAGVLQAEEESPSLLKKNSFSLKAGFHLFAGSDFTDFWMVSTKDYNGPAVEVAYERLLLKYLGLEAAAGYYRANKQYGYSSLVFAGDAASLDTTISNTYLSATLKPRFPLGRSFQLFVGGGADFYYTRATFKGQYRKGSSTLFLDENENKLSWGVHGLAGVEYLFSRRPPESGTYDMPISVFLEYKYSYVPVTDFDKKVVEDINRFGGSSVEPHDFDAGGHLAFLGLRWRF